MSPTWQRSRHRNRLESTSCINYGFWVSFFSQVLARRYLNFRVQQQNQQGFLIRNSKKVYLKLSQIYSNLNLSLFFDNIDNITCNNCVLYPTAKVCQYFSSPHQNIFYRCFSPFLNNMKVRGHVLNKINQILQYKYT